MKLRMVKTFFLSVALTLVVGCGGGSDNSSPENPDANPAPSPNPSPNPVPDSTPNAGGNGVIWQGVTEPGYTGVFVIDDQQNLYGLSSNGQGLYKSYHGKTDGNVARFNHRDGDNPALGADPTVVGDPDQQFASILYSFSEIEDGSSLFVSSTLGEFTMTRVDNSVTLAEAVGSWQTRTSYCAAPEVCALGVDLTIDANGGVVGQLTNNFQGTVLPTQNITGTISGSGQFLAVELAWDQQTRRGILYRDVTTAKLVINAAGVQSAEDGVRPFLTVLNPAP